MTLANERQQVFAEINGLVIPPDAKQKESTLYFPYPDHDLIVLISEHGSITYCSPTMLDAHLNGIT